MHFKENRRLLACGTALAGLLIATNASAQDTARASSPASMATVQDGAQAGQAAPAAGDGNGLGDIVVTARKRSESLQSVPIAVTAFGQEDIARKGIVDAQSLELSASSFTLDLLGATHVRTAIRGLGSDNTSPGQEFSTAMFLDGVPMGTGGMAGVDVFDVERIEVLKGPQGNLYGKNVVGGAVNVIPTHAKLGDMSAILSATLGNYGEIDADGYVNLSNSETFAQRLAFTIQRHDGYVKNLSGKGDPDNENHQGVRYSLAWKPASRLHFDFTFDYSHDQGNGRGGYVAGNRPYNPDGSPVTSPRSYSALALHAVDVPFEVNLQDPGYVRRNMWGLRLGAEYDFGGGVAFNLVTSYRHDKDGYFHNDTGVEISDPLVQQVVDQTVVPGAAFPGGDGYEAGFGLRDTADQFTIEGRLSQQTSRAQWTAGIFYSALDYGQLIDFRLNQINCEGARSLAAGTCAFSYANDAADVHALTHDLGIFGEITYKILDKLSLTAGARYSKTGKQFFWTNNVARRTGSAFSGPVLAAPYLDARSWDDLTYKVTADYKFTPSVMIYASYATGFKPGGYGGLTDSRTLVPTTAEKVRAAEIGFKGTLGRIRLNAALFDMRLTGLQVTQVQAGSTQAASFVSVDSVKVRGGEAELIVSPVDNWVIDLQYTYLDATLRGYPTAPTTTFILQRAPRNELTIDSHYKFTGAIGGGDVELGGTFSYRSKVFDDPDDSSGEIRPPRSLIDAYLTWTAPGGGVSVKLWGRNLTNEIYYNRITDSLDGSFANLGAPRTFGATLTKKF